MQHITIAVFASEGQLSILQALAGSILVPPAVLVELEAGIAKGLDLPQPENLKWVRIQAPVSAKAVSLITDLGPGESQVLMLALEMPGSILLISSRSWASAFPNRREKPY